MQKPDEPPVPVTPELTATAAQIAKAISGLGKDAGDKLRKLFIPNLSDPENHALRAQLRGGAITAEKFVTMKEDAFCGTPTRSRR